MMFFDAIYLTYRILTQISIVSGTGLPSTSLAIWKMPSSSRGPREKTATIRSLITNIPPATSKSHLRYVEDGASAFFVSGSFLKNLVMATTLHPRISVVMAVATALTAYPAGMILSRISAAKVPRRYPRMFITITMAAVNSMLSPFFMQIISARAIVRTVRRSSSPTPARRHPSATSAWSKANICIIQANFICFMDHIFRKRHQR